MRKGFVRFKAGNFRLKDQELPGRLSTTNELIKTEIQNNQHSTFRRNGNNKLNKLKIAIQRPEVANQKGFSFQQDKIAGVWLWCLTPAPCFLGFPPFPIITIQSSKNFNSLVQITTHLNNFFAEKPEKFCKDGILKLHER